MMTDIDGGKIGTVLVKDMSRVGRDYLQTGFYTEIYFKEKDVRFIAIDSHVDNSRSDSLEFAPMLNVLNEMYLHDLSKKVNIGFRAKGMSGQSLTSTPPFGYKRDPEDKNHWMIEPETAEVVRRIFELAATGMNPHRIAKTLQTERRITTSTYFRRSGMGRRLSCFPRVRSTRKRFGLSSLWKIWICPNFRMGQPIRRSRSMCWSIPG